ncbi:MAG: bifunctional folylpolyglutamate synthase/dihydrofolate synthase [Clostridia bacterium]|nr:bifunctional folylpolyglutamate synthase/dihydrofolate synthase [Clostridia bacterium]
MIYTDAVAYVHSLLKFGVRPGLSGMDALLHLLGDPHKELKYVHVAGTNGKGSTSTAVSNILIDAGYRVGLYTSPYVTEFLERVQVDGRPVDKAVFAQGVSRVKSAVEQLNDEGVTITEFEALTAAAFLCYKALGCNVVVLEVGLGGRLDATNVIDTPLVNIITSLSIDHSAILGNTVEEIAFEKCGTIKQGGNVVCSMGQPDGAMKVVCSTVNERGNTLIVPDVNDVELVKNDVFGVTFKYKGEEYSVPMAGEHQVKNMTCAIECARILKNTFNITDGNVKNGISKTVLPARVEVISHKPLVILDGGHNKDGAQAFYNAVVPHIETAERVIVVAGMMADKAVEESLAPLLSKADYMLAVTPDNPRAMSGAELAKIASAYTTSLFVENVGEAIEIAHRAATENSAVLVVGSLYLAGEVRGKLLEYFS